MSQPIVIPQLDGPVYAAPAHAAMLAPAGLIVIDDDDAVVPVLPNEEQPTGLVKSLCATLKEMKKGKDISLPIKKIKNIGAKISIFKQSKTGYIFNIAPTEFEVEDDSIFRCNYQRNVTLNEPESDFILRVVKDILITLKTVQINKLYGTLMTTTPVPQTMKMDALWIDFCEEFKDDENLVMALNECCVCFTMTKTTTNCGHTVCLECISKIKTETEVEDYIIEDYKNCPMCRQRIVCLK